MNKKQKDKLRQENKAKERLTYIFSNGNRHSKRMAIAQLKAMNKK